MSNSRSGEEDTICSLYQHSSAAYRHHEHGTALAYGLVIDVYTHYGVGSHTAGSLLHLCQGGVFGLAEHLLITAGAASDDVTDAREEVFHEVGAMMDSPVTMPL